METKATIMDFARKQFNQNGLAKTSVRTICNEMDISPGSFSYHYPDKDKIVEDLYEQMQREVYDGIHNLAYSPETFRGYLEAHRVIFFVKLKYKFIYLNLFEIITKHPKIKQQYLKELDKEKRTAKELLNAYMENGILRRGADKSYIERSLIVGHLVHNTWVIETEISFKGNGLEKLKYYMTVACSFILPFLSDKSLAEYNEFLRDLGK